MSSFWTNVPSMKEPISHLRQKLLLLGEDETGVLREMLEDQFSRPGKYLRGGFCILAGQTGGRNSQSVLDAAAALEAFHLATLVHDDIIDGAASRRGKPAAHIEYGTGNTVLLGDFLFSKSLYILSSLLEGQEHEKGLAVGIMQICRQEINQTLSKEMNWSPREYYRRVAGKTASLFTLSLNIGARISEASQPVRQQLRRFGYSMGMAFQIIDDLLDISPETPTGKPSYQDLKNGLTTLPLILALKSSPEKQRLARNAMQQGNWNHLIRMIEEGKGIEQARARAESYTLNCYNLLKQLPGGAARQGLEEVTRLCLNRNF